MYRNEFLCNSYLSRDRGWPQPRWHPALLLLRNSSYHLTTTLNPLVLLEKPARMCSYSAHHHRLEEPPRSTTRQERRRRGPSGSPDDTGLRSVSFRLSCRLILGLVPRWHLFAARFIAGPKTLIKLARVDNFLLFSKYLMRGFGRKMKLISFKDRRIDDPLMDVILTSFNFARNLKNQRKKKSFSTSKRWPSLLSLALHNFSAFLRIMSLFSDSLDIFN